MGASIPKQYLKLRGKPIATYSLDTFSMMRQVGELIIVCDPSYQELFEKCFPGLPKHLKLKWALPGTERQDSVYNGLQQVRHRRGGGGPSPPHMSSHQAQAGGGHLLTFRRGGGPSPPHIQATSAMEGCAIHTHSLTVTHPHSLTATQPRSLTSSMRPHTHGLH